MNHSETRGLSASSAQPLLGRRALITGSTGGLGLSMAECLAKAGCDLMLNGLEEASSFEQKCQDISKAYRTNVHYTQADLSSEAEVIRLVEVSCAQLGGVDILINNAVVRHFAPIVEFSAEKWNEALAVNLSAAFHATRAVLPHMRAQNFGRIFNITSVYGMRGTINRVGYVTTKAAILGLTRAMALENLDFDVTCNSICPGSVLTPGTDTRIVDMMEDEGLDRATAERSFLEGKQPGGQFVQAESVAAMLVFLCGPHSGDMTGSMFPVEGGWLAS